MVEDDIKLQITKCKMFVNIFGKYFLRMIIKKIKFNTLCPQCFIYIFTKNMKYESNKRTDEHVISCLSKFNSNPVGSFANNQVIFQL